MSQDKPPEEPWVPPEREKATRHREKRRQYQRGYTERLRSQLELVDGRWVHPNPRGGHGSITAYTACGCRCDACREVMRTYSRKAARVRKEREAAKIVPAAPMTMVDPSEVFKF